MPGFFDNLYGDPNQAGLLGLSAGLLGASGPSRQPVSFGQSLSRGLLASNAMFNAATQAEQRSGLVDAQTKQLTLENELLQRNLNAPPRPEFKTAKPGETLLQIGPDGRPMPVYSAPFEPPDEWSPPMVLGGQYVQQNKKTGQIRQAVTQPTQVTQQNFPPPSVALNPVTGQPELVQFGSRGEVRPTGLRPPKTAQELKVEEEAKKATARGQEATETANVVIRKVDEALKDVGPLTTGAIGAVTGLVPGTKAYDLDKTIDTIKANVGFKELAEMRANSPTGGALGQIAVRELDFLQAAISSLDKKQSPAKLRQNLGEIKSSFERWKATVREAGGLPPEQIPSGGGTGKTGNPLIDKYLTP